MRSLVQLAALCTISLLSIDPVLANSEGADRESRGLGPTPDNYVGGRGLITQEGPTGMFLNPTSGTLRQGSLVTQYCVWFTAVANNHRTTHGVLATYGVTDWLETGAYGQFIDGLGTAVGNDYVDAAQASVRIRLLRDKGGVPELSVGAFTQHGNDIQRKDTIYVAASKFIPLGDPTIIRGIRLHAGFRQLWQRGDEGSIFYGGAEIGLGYDLYLVGEVSTRDNFYTEMPWSAGLQYRRPDGFGLSFAVTQTGFASELASYVGIGVNF